MKAKQNKIQIALIIIGVLLIIITYFYYPHITKVKFEENKSIETDLSESSAEDQETVFEKVEYKGVYDINKTFTVNSDEAYILNEEPDVVFMKNMQVLLYLEDGRIVEILSDKGKYNKVTYDCFFEINVRATDGETKIYSENLDLLATENTVGIYNNVTINFPTGSIKADKIDYDFETKYFKVSMFSDKSIKMKVFK